VKIGVCIKPVPNSDARIAIAGSGNGVDNSVYSKLMLGTYDECAIEAAVQLKEQGVADEVIVFTVGPNDKGAKDQLITALAKGADRALVVDNTDFASADCLGVAQVLAGLAQKEGVEVLLCGKQSMDGDNAQIPSMLGELLDWAIVPVISKLDVEGTEFTAHKDLGSGTTAVVKGAFPAVFSCDKNLNKPRNPNLKAKMAAKKKPIEALNLGDLDLTADAISSGAVSEVNWTLPPKREECKFIDAGNVDAAVAELLSLLKNEAKVL
jgi:electron transfer flavoprotein beta subunit